jgi:hypothetical protein
MQCYDHRIMDAQAAKCEVCGGPAEFALTEIVSVRRVVVTHHYCKAHRPQDDDMAFKTEVDAAFSDTRARLRELEEWVYKELDKRDNQAGG